MKKYIFALAAATTLLGACEVEDKYYGKAVVDPAEKLEPAYAEDWTANADQIDAKLIENFMDTNRGIFWNTDQNRLNNNGNNYWGQAPAMDVILDAYLRLPAGDARRATYEGYMSKWYDNRANNWAGSGYGSTGFGNPFTDDCEWITLTLIRMYEATGIEKYLATAATIYDECIISRWTDDENGGGLRWSLSESNSKNACSNGPGVLCAMRLYANTTDEAARAKYLADAQKVYGWLVATLYNPLTGAVSDNMAGGKISGGALTYNQGTFLGGAYELYKATGDKKYMTEAARATRYTMNSMVSGGVLQNEGTGDNSLFKGIFVRYAMKVWKDAAVDAFDASLRGEIKDFLVYNAYICWTNGVDKSEGSKWFFGTDWNTVGSSWDGRLGEQVSASTVIEAAAVLTAK